MKRENCDCYDEPYDRCLVDDTRCKGINCPYSKDIEFKDDEMSEKERSKG